MSLVDEHRGEAGAAALLNAQGRFDLWQVINGDALITQAVVAGWSRPARWCRRRGWRSSAMACRTQRSSAQLDQCWRAVCDGADVVVIDASGGHGGRLSPLRRRSLAPGAGHRRRQRRA
ncbi:MAG: hypothetical protein MZW92_52330 [Comamonadaceae bacterium]|nr:hypothetical protein [Comamonadaceae bacterium]